MALLITKAKPNPVGKDRKGRTFTPAPQLAAEWVDIQNSGGTPVALGNVELYHYAYSQGQQPRWELALGFTGTLGAGEIVRVHSGDPIPLTQMHLEDRTGAHHHVFTRKNYIWNNDRADYPRLWYAPTKQWLDQTEYSAPVPEGKVLIRVSTRLV